DVAARQSAVGDRRTGAKAHFGREHDVVTAFAEELAEHDFRLAAGIEIGGVEKIHPGVERALDHRPGILPIDFVDRRLRRVAAESHGAEGEPRYDQAAVAETRVLHGFTFRVRATGRAN